MRQDALKAQQMKPYLIRHDSQARIYWDIFVIALALYNSILLPLQVAFGVQTDATFDYVIDAFFAIDIILNFRTTYLNVGSHEVGEPKKIAFNYMFS